MGKYVNVENKENGDMTIRLVPGAQQTIQSLQKQHDYDTVWKRLFEDIPEYIYHPSGTIVLTSSPVFEHRTSHVLYWFPEYEQKDELLLLVQEGEVIFTKVDE